MKEQHLWQLLEGLGTSLQLTAASLLVGCILSLLMTVSLVMRTPVVHWFSRAVITLFTGTPLLVQIFLVYYGPGQFEWIREKRTLGMAQPTLVLRYAGFGAQHCGVQHATV